MFSPVRESTFGEQCPVLIKHTFIDVQCPEEEHEHVMRRQKSDPLFTNIGSKIRYPTLSLRCEEPLKKLSLEAPPTPTTCDDCSTPASLFDDSLTPTTADDSSEVFDEDDIKVQGNTFTFADAVKHLDDIDASSHEDQQDTPVCTPRLCGLPRALQARESWQPSMRWTEFDDATPMVSMQQQQQQQALATKYQWTGDASSRIPMMSTNLVQDQRSTYLNSGNEALAMPLSPSCNSHGNYYHEAASGYTNTGLRHQHCDYYMQSNQVLDTAATMLPPPPPPPPPAHSMKLQHTSKPCEARAEEMTETPTTLMVRNLPSDLSQPLLVEAFKAAGYGGLFDFVYMPMNFRGQGNFGYAFVDFISHEVAIQFISHAKTVQHGSDDDLQTWDAVWSTCQGLSANIERYRNSPLMHELVPKECKPTVYDEAGTQVAFPAPTKNIPKPRIHWPSPKDANKGVKDTQLPALAQGSSQDSQCVDLVPERRPGRSKNHQRQQVTMQRRK